MNRRTDVLDEETSYKLLKLLEQDPHSSQRDLARAMGISLGKTNYCLKCLVEKGLVKVRNFYRNEDKRVYAYLLTPQGIEEKARVTMNFLRRKQREYEALKVEIEQLRSEAAQLNEGEANSPVDTQ